MLGNLSAKYESNGDPGCVSGGVGDAGGVSYGAYQLATNAGSVQSFVRWLQSTGNPYGDWLAKYEPGSDAFSAEWRSIAAEDPDGFLTDQHDYIRYAYYEPAVAALADAGFHIGNHSEVMQDVVWSRAVQYGTGYIVEMFEDACRAMGYPNLSYIDAANFDADLIRAIYLTVCHSEEWTGGSPSLRYGLYSRFENECQDALARLA